MEQKWGGGGGGCGACKKKGVKGKIPEELGPVRLYGGEGGGG